MSLLDVIIDVSEILVKGLLIFLKNPV